MSMQCWVCMVCWEFLSCVVNFTAAECGRIWYGSSFMWKAVEQAVLSTVCISECVESFLLCIVGKMAQDVGMV